MYIGTGRYPDSLQAILLEHIVKGGKDFNVTVFEELACPLQLGLVVRTNGNESGVRNTIQQCLCMTLAHSTQTDYRNVESGGRSLRRHVVKRVHNDERLEDSEIIAMGREEKKGYGLCTGHIFG